MIIADRSGPRSFVLEADSDEEEWLSEFLTFQTREYNGYKWKVVDHPYYDISTRSLPRGLSRIVEKYAPESGFQCQRILDLGPEPERNPEADLSWLHDFQRESVDGCVQETNGVIASPTGSGKGEMITGLVWGRNCTWLVLVDSETLISDLTNRFARRTGEVPGCLTSKKVDLQRVNYGTFTGVRSKMRDVRVRAMLSQVRGVIGDECHTAAAATSSQVLDILPNTYYRIGFSATPLDRTDQKSIAVIANFGPVIRKIRTRTLIDLGIVSEPNLRMVPFFHEKAVYRKYATAYRNCVVKSLPRNQLIVDIMKVADRPGFVFVKHDEHGTSLLRMARSAGLTVELVNGNTPEFERQQRLKQMKRSEVDFIIGSKVFYKGIDVVNTRSVINAAGAKSPIETLQKLGRGTRREHAGDDDFELWDIYDGGQKWLADHSRGRAKLYLREDYKVKITNSLNSLEEYTLFSEEGAIRWK